MRRDEFSTRLSPTHAQSLLTARPPGPRLYKEPSAKSNKFIIHNALSHCCLAGKVNEPQKNRILEVSPTPVWVGRTGR